MYLSVTSSLLPLSLANDKAPRPPGTKGHSVVPPCLGRSCSGLELGTLLAHPPPLASAITGANRRRLQGGLLRPCSGQACPPFPGATPGRVRPLYAGYPCHQRPSKAPLPGFHRHPALCEGRPTTPVHSLWRITNRISLMAIRDLVDLKGLEPLTFSMPLRRAPNCATGPRRNLVSSQYFGATLS